MVTMLRIGDRRHWNGEQPGEEDRHAQVSIIFNLPRKGLKQEVGDHEPVSIVDHGVGNIRESGVCP